MNLLLVSVPYEITLLSNNNWTSITAVTVSVPYEITLLSNYIFLIQLLKLVSVPYEITLLSNIKTVITKTPKFQYLMKLHYSQTLVTTIASNPLVSVPYEITLLSNTPLT